MFESSIKCVKEDKGHTTRAKKEVPHVIDGCVYVWVEGGIHVRDSPDQKLFLKFYISLQIRKEKDTGRSEEGWAVNCQSRLQLRQNIKMKIEFTNYIWRILIQLLSLFSVLICYFKDMSTEYEILGGWRKKIWFWFLFYTS